MTSPLNNPALEAQLDRLHGQSAAQDQAASAYFSKRFKEGSLSDLTTFDDDAHAFFADKMVALEKDKAEFCYLLCRALRAQRVVEIGTSFGVSTLYLAAALRDNGAAAGAVTATSKLRLSLDGSRSFATNWASATVPSSTATVRAASRAACSIVCRMCSIDPNSMAPKTSIIRIGIMNAPSRTETPRRVARFFRHAIGDLLRMRPGCRGRWPARRGYVWIPRGGA